MKLGRGDRVDRYVLVEPLGRGGQGHVWKAEDPLAGAVRALKLLAIDETTAVDLERMRREARLLARLDHPSLCKVHGLFEDVHHEVLGFAMDLVEGRSLAEVLGDARPTGVHVEGHLGDARLTRVHVESLLGHVARALACLHAAGIVHRDLKPANVLLTEPFWRAPAEPGLVRVVDLGIATARAHERLTGVGTRMGTAFAMAPEQIEPSAWTEGEPLGAAADVFAWGLLAWRLLTGGHPTGLDDAAPLGDFAIAYRRAAELPSWPTRADPDAWLILAAHCLRLRPSDRPRDGAALVAALGALAGHTEPEARGGAAPPPVTAEHRSASKPNAPSPPTPRTPAPHAPAPSAPAPSAPAPKPRAPVALVGVAGVVVVGALGVGLFAASRADESGATGPLDTAAASRSSSAPPAPSAAAFRSSSAPPLPSGTSYRARLSYRDHDALPGVPSSSNHAPRCESFGKCVIARILGMDRYRFHRGEGDQEDEPDAVFPGDRAGQQRFIEKTLSPLMEEPAPRRLKRRISCGEPLVEVTLGTGTLDVRIVRGDCRDLRALLRTCSDLPLVPSGVKDLLARMSTASEKECSEVMATFDEKWLDRCCPMSLVPDG
ncbi:MAG: serine/threonine protein kinase [Polyangiaceae bacterium]|nr:serine/threonine protein kinase [Polyangiaceae bacterium]